MTLIYNLEDTLKFKVKNSFSILISNYENAFEALDFNKHPSKSWDTRTVITVISILHKHFVVVVVVVTISKYM